MPHQRTYNPLILPLSSPSPPPLSLLITRSPYHRSHHSFPRPHVSNNAPTHLIYPEIRAQKTSRACDSCVCNTTADTDGNNERTAGETSLSLLWLYCYVCLCIWCYIYEFITIETVSMYSGEIVVLFVQVLEWWYQRSAGETSLLLLLSSLPKFHSFNQKFICLCITYIYI